VLLIDLDSKKDFPELALMKLSTSHKALGDNVKLVCRPTIDRKKHGNKSTITSIDMFGHKPDKVYIACVFDKNKSKAIALGDCYKTSEVVYGGSGLNFDTLPDDIEHILPDYLLYGVDYSMGFTSRGCLRRCPFCIVWKKEGKIKDNAPISEFMHPDHKKLILLDNNFTASPKFDENLKFIIDNSLKVNFNQGLDIRLMTEEKAGLIADTKYYNWTFISRRLHFAWDFMEAEKDVERGIQFLNNAGIPSRHLMVYMICHYNTDFGQDMYRFKKLVEWGCDPYVMIFNNYREDKRLLDFKRYVNRRVYKSKSCPSFDDYQRSFSRDDINAGISTGQTV